MAKARKNNPNNKDEQFYLNSEKTVKPSDTRKELAKIAGTSEDDISIFICNNKNYMYNLDKTKRWRIKHGN